MAEKRMFAKKMIDSDLFLDMPQSTQLLYFHLSMHADDDGFIDCYKKIMRVVGCKEDDLKILLAKRFLLEFETGVIVIRHWRINNYLRKDRYTETIYKEEKSLLGMRDKDSPYEFLTKDTNGIPVGILDKSREDKNRVDNSRDKPIDEITSKKEKPIKHKYGEFNHVLLTDDEKDKLIEQYGESSFSSFIKILDEYIEMSGKKYKNHNLAIRKWVIERANQNKNNTSSTGSNEMKPMQDRKF